MKPPPTPEQLDFTRRLVFFIDEARRLGLYKTSHRLHDAERELGWELSGTEMPESERKRMYCNVSGVKS